MSHIVNGVKALRIIRVMKRLYQNSLELKYNQLINLENILKKIFLMIDFIYKIGHTLRERFLLNLNKTSFFLIYSMNY